MMDSDEDDVVGKAVRRKRKFPTASSTFIPTAAKAATERAEAPARPGAVRLLGRLARRGEA